MKHLSHYTVTITNGEKWAFLEVTHGRYIRTHRCVNYVGCSRCGAKRHEPCVNGDTGNPVSEVHHSRKDAFKSAVVAELDAEHASRPRFRRVK